LIISCGKVAFIEERPAQEQQINAENEVVIPSETKEETKPTEEETPVESALETILKEKVSFISGALPGAELNTKTGELTAKVGNEWGIEAGESIGWYVVGAFTMEKPDGVEEEQDALGLAPEVIRKILNENKEKGIFKFPWPFNFQENEGVEIVELVIANGGYKRMGIKYTEPINVYAPSDCVYGYTGKYIPQENDPYSSQDYSGIYLSTGFESKNKYGDIVPVDYEIDVVNWVPSAKLDQAELSGPWELQDFVEEIKIGQLLGQLLPTNPNYSFLDLYNKSDVYKNPNHCQASFWIDIFGDRTDIRSDLERVLKVGEKDNEITVFVWPENQKTAHEQNK